MIARLVLCCCAAAEILWAQASIELRGLSVYGGTNEKNLPIIVRPKVDKDGKPIGKSGRITIQFDILAAEVPALKIRFWHCNRDWKPDDNLFVNDNNHNTSFYLDYRTSPGGVKGYNYRYTNSFPDADDAVRFDYSGNWIFRITDAKETVLLADGRLMVVDDVSPTSVTVTNDYLTENASPYNQIHKVIARVKLPDEIEGARYTTVDVYQNRKLYSPFRIDMSDRDPYTFVEGQNTGERIFKISNIMPGNEYRVLDLSNVTRYPNRAVVRNVNGVDQVRQFWRTGPDHNGEAILNSFTGLNSDYLDVLFRLDMTATDYRAATKGGREIFVAGQFNFWNPTDADKLIYDEQERAYVVKETLRRGIYDYQYVAGLWDETAQQLLDQDWLVLEGNDWRTTNIYTVLVYYNDPRFGGFDRIVGIGHAQSAQTASSN